MRKHHCVVRWGGADWIQPPRDSWMQTVPKHWKEITCSHGLLPSKWVGMPSIFYILLLINAKARIQALFYFIIPHHIPLLWCLYFCAPNIQHASYHNVRFKKKPSHTSKKMTANLHALSLTWSCQANQKQNKKNIQERFEVNSIIVSSMSDKTLNVIMT